MNDKDLQTTLVVQEGDNIRLPCIAEGVPPPKYSWKRSDNRAIRTASWSSECHSCALDKYNHDIQCSQSKGNKYRRVSFSLPVVMTGHLVFLFCVLLCCYLTESLFDVPFFRWQTLR
jgi:hypothetical protein